jgi:hypothetical protein
MAQCKGMDHQQLPNEGASDFEAHKSSSFPEGSGRWREMPSPPHGFRFTLPSGTIVTTRTNTTCSPIHRQ